MTRTAAILAAAAAIALAAPAHAVSTPGWDGVYVWEDALGRIGGSTAAESPAAFVTYTLTIGLGTGETGCWLSAQGFQKDNEIACVPDVQGNSLVIRFDHAEKGARYTNGAALMTLTRSSGALITQLQALRDSRNIARKGLLFRPAEVD